MLLCTSCNFAAGQHHKHCHVLGWSPSVVPAPRRTVFGGETRSSSSVGFAGQTGFSNGRPVPSGHDHLHGGRQASASTSAARASSVLATYPFPRTSSPFMSAGQASSWLAKALKHVCSSLPVTSSTPTAQLHLVTFDTLLQQAAVQPSFITLSVAPEIANDPQSWPQLSQQVRGTSAQGLLLLRPLPAAQEAVLCKDRGLACSSQSSAGSCSAFGGSALSSMNGTFDDSCCSEDSSLQGHGQRDASSQPHAHPMPDSLPHTSRTSAISSAYTPITRHHGLVVQGALPSSADGCYVLKTTHSMVQGCACIHYSLTHVCHGTPLAQQLREAWLV